MLRIDPDVIAPLLVVGFVVFSAIPIPVAGHPISGGPAHSDSNAANRSFTQDKPNVKITVNGEEIDRGEAVTNRDEYTITVQASVDEGASEGSTIQLVSLEIDGSTYETREADSETVTTQFTPPELAYGHHEFKVVVKDSNGEITTFRFSIIEDPQPPLVWFVEPFATSQHEDIGSHTVNKAEITLRGRIKDVSKKAVVEITQSAPGYSTSFETTFQHEGLVRSTYPINHSFSEGIILVAGVNRFDLITRDELGNDDIQEFNITLVDNEPPSISIDTPLIVNKSQTTIESTISDNVWVKNVSFRAGYTLSNVVQRSYAPGKRQLPVNYSKSVELDFGENPITIIAYDHGGRKATKTVTITRQRPEDYGYDPPTITIDRDETRFVSDDTIAVNGTVDGDNLTFVRLETIDINGNTLDFITLSSDTPQDQITINEELQVGAVESRVVIEVRDQNGTSRKTSFIVHSANETVFSDEGSETETEESVESAGQSETPKPVLVNDINVPSEVVLGQSFTLRVEVNNTGGKGGQWSTISVAFPSLNEATAEQQLSIKGDSFNEYRGIATSGDPIKDKNGNDIAADYALVEAGTDEDSFWQSGSKHFLSVEVTPKQTGTFVVLLRATITDVDNVSNTFTFPPTSSTTDQQGFPARRIEINVVSSDKSDGSNSTDPAFTGNLPTSVPLDTQSELIASVVIDESPYSVYKVENMIPYASGIEIYSNGTEVTEESEVNRVISRLAAIRVLDSVETDVTPSAVTSRSEAETKFTAAAWQIAATELSSEDMQQLQRISETANRIDQLVSPPLSAINTILGIFEEMREYGLLGVTAWDVATDAHPQLAEYENALERLQTELREWNSAAERVTENINPAISSLEKAQKGQDVDYGKISSQLKTAADALEQLRSKSDEIESSLSATSDDANDAAEALEASQVPSDFVQPLRELSQRLDGAASEVNSFSKTLEESSSQISGVRTSAQEKQQQFLEQWEAERSGLRSQWKARQSAQMRVFATIGGGVVILVGLLLLARRFV